MVRRIKDWSVVPIDSHSIAVQGNVYGDKELPDGTFTQTGEVKVLDMVEGTVRTKSGDYKLGKVLLW